MAIFLVTVTFADDQSTRDAARPAHREWVDELLADGSLLASGPLGEVVVPDAAAERVTEHPARQYGALVIRAESEPDALRIVEADPYRAAALITDVEAQEWDVVVGRVG